MGCHALAHARYAARMSARDAVEETPSTFIASTATKRYTELRRIELRDWRRKRNEKLWLFREGRLGTKHSEMGTSGNKFNFVSSSAVSAHGGGVLTFTSARVLVRELVGGPGSQPTDREDDALCAVHALVPTLSVLPPHVCHRQGTGLSP